MLIARNQFVMQQEPDAPAPEPVTPGIPAPTEPTGPTDPYPVSDPIAEPNPEPFPAPPEPIPTFPPDVTF